MVAPPPPAGRPVDVVGIGATSVDSVYLLPSGPGSPGFPPKVRIGGRFVSCGGQIATALATCARMGLRARLASVIGSDDNGRRVRDELRDLGVDVNDAVVRDAPNQCAIVLVDRRTGERTVLWDRDERLMLQDGDLRPHLFGAARVVHVDDVDEEGAIRSAEAARAAGTPVTSDIDRVTDRTAALVQAVTFPIFAEHVPQALTGLSDAGKALRALRTLHRGVMCVTLGARGAIAIEGDRLLHSPGFAVEALDTTGAGDVFRAGFIYGYLKGFALDEILRFANAAAALSCTRLGAMASVPSVQEVERLMAAAGAVGP
jgi:sugar/nucleoside kinase (ribokinase family)